MAYGQNGFLLAWSYKPLAISHQLLKIGIAKAVRPNQVPSFVDSR